MREQIKDSWFRCFQAELDKKTENPLINIASNKLFKLQNKYQNLIKIFLANSQKLTDQYFTIQPLGSILLSQKGIALAVHLSKNSSNLFKEFRPKTGQSWQEESFGTNALSISLELRERVIFASNENYLFKLHDFKTIAQPLEIDNNPAAFLLMLTNKEYNSEKLELLHELLITRIKRDFQQLEKLKNNTQLSLTEISKLILELSANGLTIKETSQRLDLSEAAIKYHRNKICQQLHAANISQAVAKSIKYGVLNLNAIS